jgi:putative beta-lysine N-acetyltransferase
MHDRIERLGRSTIQHGPLNDRVYLMKLHDDDMPGILPLLDWLADANGYSKIFAKIRARHVEVFEKSGYRLEAHIPGFYNRFEDAAFMGKFLDGIREGDSRAREAGKILEAARRKRSEGVGTNTDEAPCVERASPRDAEEMSEVYGRVFPSYPFPIHDPGYLRGTMHSHVTYFCIREAGKIVSLSSAEVDGDGRNVEMTDFATLPDHRGSGHAVHLLDRMEDEMVNRDITTSYTIARAMSPGMNITFAKLGYVYAGTLVNNTNISGSIESMNVWYKHL